MKESSWDLAYFDLAVDEVVGPILRERGYDSISRDFGVEYHRADHRIEFSWDRDAPFMLLVSVGLAEEATVGLWRTAPPTVDLPSPVFVDDETLRRTLASLGTILEDSSWWADLETIRAAEDAQRREADENYKRGIREQALRAARLSFETGEVASAIAQYEALGEADLSARDARYLYLARKEITSG